MARSSSRARLVTGISLVLAAAALAATESSAQDPDGYILIEEPSFWRGEGARGITVRQKHSIRVVGEARHPSGVYEIRIDGTPASIDPRPNNVVRFVGYANPEPGTAEAEIVAYPREGDPIIRTFPYAIETAATAYDSPDEAWSSGQFNGERYAVVIGVSDYRDPNITRLQYADDDAQLFYDFLVSPAAGLGGFKPENIQFLKNEEATTRAIRTAMSGFLRPVTDRDVVVFYFAGHGAPDPYARQDHYFLTHDTDANDIAATAYPMTEVWDRIGRLRARDIVVIADACHSAAVTNTLASRALTDNDINLAFVERLQTTAAGKLIFTAAETNQLSFEDTQWGDGHGVFTWKLVEGLRGAADEDGDRIVTLHEMVEYTRYEVQRETGSLQIPDISGQFDRAWPMAIVQSGTVAEAPAAEPEVTAPVTPPVTTPAAAQPAEEEETAPAEEETTTTLTRADVDLMSAGWAFTHSFIIPGSGQMRTGRGIRGFLVLAGVAGAAGYVYATRELHQECRVVPRPTCPDSDVLGTKTVFPSERLIPAAAAAGGLVFIGALDAFFGAKGVNNRRLRDAGVIESEDMALRILPSEPVLTSRTGDLSLVELRFR